ncbi:ribokinase [Halalkalibacillus sediminis]|uniref:Ribokinase n=1 Tax=Halalkalibacillus sediminis TaxID=2018042 RepID=A0A2I0QUC8_9BACI|nr:ribokinase [Halalkalibacillus sediminis]PKR77926.1 ribokinase [Halalkalibacillus sediminis]
MKQPKITVIGSVNMDLVTATDHFPSKGETLLGKSFSTIPGGKGANQAIAASKLGSDVTFIGCIGDDTFADPLIENFRHNKIHTDFVERISTEPTGIASITIAENDNTIIVVPGANHSVSPTFVEKREDVIASSDAIIVQLEIPLESVKKAVELAYRNGVKVILNPAPAQQVDLEILRKVDFITPNEHELPILLNNEAKREFFKNNKEKFIVTKGSKGVQLFWGETSLIPGFTVDVVDTTGAGDTFNGAFASAISSGQSIEQACLFGNAAGALSVMQLGAQTGMPTREDVLDFMNERGVKHETSWNFE